MHRLPNRKEKGNITRSTIQTKTQSSFRLSKHPFPLQTKTNRNVPSTECCPHTPYKNTSWGLFFCGSRWFGGARVSSLIFCAAPWVRCAVCEGVATQTPIVLLCGHWLGLLCCVCTLARTASEIWAWSTSSKPPTHLFSFF